MANYTPLKQADPALAKAILYVLGWHIGRERVIGGEDLVKQPEVRACTNDERVVRETIRLLRRDGHLICSAPGENGGYWMAANWQELDEFTERELHGKAMDMLETESALRRAAKARWGEAQQLGMF